jgi:hypothetical protein
MKTLQTTLLLLFLFCVGTTEAQNNEFKIFLKSGSTIPEKNITDRTLQQFELGTAKFDGKSYCILQLEHIPNQQEIIELKNAGIVLLEYIPSKAYLVAINKTLQAENLMRLKVRSLITLKNEDKIAADVAPALQAGGTDKIWIALHNDVNANTAIAALKNSGYTISSVEHQHYNILELQINSAQLLNIAALPFVKYIENAPPPPVNLDIDNRNNARVNLLQTGIPGGYNLNGDSVVVGVLELAGAPQAHIDFADRLLVVNTPSNDYHSTHVNGIVGGAGLIDELYKGFAPKATIYGGGSGATTAWALNQAYGVVITNNSYGSGGVCARNNYSFISAILDRQSIDFPGIQNVFASGNSGNTTCPGNYYPPGFNTIYESNCTKNTVSVGNTTKDGVLHITSSKGPASGGRTKPDLVAVGMDVISTVPANGYGYGSGTSMSSPAVAGSMALMYQRYKQLHTGKNPSAALIKAITCNTATDAGNVGPDFSYGFGQLNAYRAIRAIDNNQYFNDSVANLQVKSSILAVPGNIAQLKVMLYWQDPPPSNLASRPLVNDLDITVTGPNGIIVLPYKLDTSTANITNPATRSEDHINNMEQVVIDFPAAGNYTITVKGTEIGQNTQQEYFVTYDQLPNNILLTYPNGNEALLPNENITIQWDCWGEPNSTYRLDFSADNGVTWQAINSNIPAGTKRYDWQLPNISTTTALIKLTRNSDEKISNSGNFTIVGTPAISLSADQCPSSISMQWNAVANANYYEVMKITSGEMKVVDTTSGLNYTIRNLSDDSTYWVTVRSVINNKPGRRAVALPRKPDNGNCTSSIFDNDLKMDSLISPFRGRKFTSAQLTAAEEIVVRLKNLDNQPASNYSISYSVNNGSWITENTVAPIAATGTLLYHFINRYDFSASGNYVIKLAVSNNLPDANKKNDTLQYTIRQLSNDPLNLTTRFIEKFEQVNPVTYSSSVFGIPGVDRFDYAINSGDGVLNFPLNDLSDTSGRSAKLISNQATTAMADHIFTGTFNLSAYNTLTQNIGLSFTLASITGCGNCIDSVSVLQIRGSDTLPWITVMKLNPTGQSVPQKKIENIDLKKLLNTAGQNFSASFQIRFKQANSYNTSYNIDDIILYNASNNLAITFADSIAIKNCGLSTLPLRIKLSNTSNSNATNVQVHYKINSNTTVTETVPIVSANTTTSYTFIQPLNIAAFGYDTITIWCDNPNDTYPVNNSQTIIIRNQPLISSFPYIENFERNDGYWYSEGKNNSWAYGKPAAAIIKTAASGEKAWKTNLTGINNKSELSYLYSPCIDYSSLQYPTLSISIALNMDSCFFYCSQLQLQYSTDGTNWKLISGVLDSSAYNWKLLSSTYNRWHVATVSLPRVNGPVQFRFMFRSGTFTQLEGVAIDDIHIYNRPNPIYDSSLAPKLITTTISGNNGWIDLIQDKKILASINPYGQNLGNTILQTYSGNPLPVSNFHGQYYLNRSFVIDASNKLLTDSIGVRLYVMDKETDSLLFSKTCVRCTKPADAYRFGVSEYTSTKTTEINNVILDNVKGDWDFIDNAKVKTIPFDKGYYLEFKTKNTGEFWINNGGLDKKSFLPVRFVDFSVKNNSSTSTIVDWTTATEINIDHFEIQVAKGNEAYSNDNYIKLGEVKSKGPSTTTQNYSFTNDESNKNGVWYFRAKAFDEYGNYAYSKVVPIVYSNELAWGIYPNPSDGMFRLKYQVEPGKTAAVDIFNAAGAIVKKYTIAGNGFIQNFDIDLKNGVFAKGLYMIRITAGNKQYHFKVTKL